MFALMFCYLYIENRISGGATARKTPASDRLLGRILKRSWGDYSCAPSSEDCYRQERVAMAHSMTTGIFGGDHWYAGNRILAIFKLITIGGFLIWAITDVFLWIGGCHYNTADCCDGDSY